MKWFGAEEYCLLINILASTCDFMQGRRQTQVSMTTVALESNLDNQLHDLTR